MPEDEPYIQKYLRYAARQESPDIFHTWGAVATLSFAVGRNIWVDQSYFKIYPNQYIILVAGSGACKKGGALGIARKIIVDTLGDRADRLFIPGKVYPEALIRVMNKRVDDPFGSKALPTKMTRPVMVFSPELGSFLSRGMQQSGMPDLLTELYDCPDKHEHITKTSGVDQVENVCVSILGATTPSWMHDNMTPAIFGEGFVARTILVYAERPKMKSPRPKITEEEKRIRAELVARLDAISRMTGEFIFDQEAGEFYDRWYCNRQSVSGVAVESGFYEREPDHVLKLAMMFSLSAGTEPMLHQPHIEGAIKMLQQIRGTMPYALAGAQAELSQKNMYRVLEMIKKRGMGFGISQQDLGRRLFNFIDPETIQKCLVGLRQNGMIETTSDAKGHIFYRTIRYGGEDEQPEEADSSADSRAGETATDSP